MKVLVAIKRVIDPYVKIRVKQDHSGVETQNVKMAMNPFDEIAVEEAIRLKEKGLVEEVIVVSIGDKSVQETLRTGLALGADSAIHVETDQLFSSLLIAKILKQMVQKTGSQLIILGKQAIDSDNAQTGSMLAALLEWPLASFASKIMLQGDKCQVTCEVDGGLQTVELTLPAVITTDLRLNTPRYASLPNIMKAKTKPLTVIPFNSFDISPNMDMHTIDVSPPPVRKAGIKVASVQELVEKLRHEAKVLL
ncbi:MAG: electron transfer flavoprotein subunit beta/FixA family protein [Legionellales bacterium]|nr:electron transfer flavoprotein subunit beta/FixA family protein [Legionellales bacterium]